MNFQVVDSSAALRIEILKIKFGEDLLRYNNPKPADSDVNSSRNLLINLTRA